LCPKREYKHLRRNASKYKRGVMEQLELGLVVNPSRPTFNVDNVDILDNPASGA
jgi:hypothetical protein